MAKTKTSAKEVVPLLTQANTYNHMCWLGLLFIPLVYVFYALCSSKVREANMYRISEKDQRTGEAIRKNARNIMIALTGVWFILMVGIFIVNVSSTPTVKVTTPSGTYRYTYSR